MASLFLTFYPSVNASVRSRPRGPNIFRVGRGGHCRVFVAVVVALLPPPPLQDVANRTCYWTKSDCDFLLGYCVYL